MIYTNGWNVNKLQQKFLLATCNITGISSIYAYNSNIPNYIAYPIYAVWIASNLYWIKPIDNWRRKLDIFTAYFGVSWLSICGLIYKPPYWYFTNLMIGGSGLICKIISTYYSNLLEEIHDKNNKLENEGIYYCPIKNSYSWKSAIAHSGIHLFSNIGVLSLIYTYAHLHS